MAFPFINPKRQFRAKRDTSPTPIHNIYTFYESESSEPESEDIGEIDIKTFTLEQTILRELHKITLSGCSTENAIEHIGKILEVASLFNTDDSALLQDELKQNFIRRFCPPAMILEQLGEICNFKQEDEESLFHTWERCSTILQNELPPKEKDPGSFILPCAIGTTTLSNALADQGASISIMPFSLFKQLELGNPKPINMVIEMADRSMRSSMGIVTNLLVKINKFIFPVDFIILDIIEDNKVPIILGRLVLATAHTRIDVFGKKISLKVGTEQITFNINKKESLAVILPVCVINSLSEINELYEPKDLEELLLSNDDLDTFPNDNDFLPNLESNDNMFLSPTGSARFNDNSSEMLCNPNSNLSISMDDSVIPTITRT
ncbi:homeodomain-like protein [Tanacetum coccineum]